MNLHVVLGNQLFDPALLAKRVPKGSHVFMREDRRLCTYFKFHKQKIKFFLSAMRSHRDELEVKGYTVHYEMLGESRKSYLESLRGCVAKHSVTKVSIFEIEDKFFEGELKSAFPELEIFESPMFLTSRKDLSASLAGKKRPFMKTFYEAQRKHLDILVDKKGEPAGGQWSFDDQNRKPLPNKVTPPELPTVVPTSHDKAVEKLVEKEFKNHPGQIVHWIPTTRSGAKQWLENFLEERFENFGLYEDAISPRSEFIFHSVLTPFLNTGLLTPKEVVESTLSFAKTKKTPLNSVEGFIRQVIGWREFIHGIYQHFSDKQDQTNFWGHTKGLSDDWYAGTTGITPLDLAIKKTLKYGYCHHIERLMVIGSLMVLLEIEPSQAHRWFMELFLDSSDWVMGPNVYGMALFSDGGIFATKPYICGSNYYKKMGGFKDEDWCKGVDGLYWSFIEKKSKFFMKNPRTAIMTKTVEKMDPKRKKDLWLAADALRRKLTV